MTTPGSPEPSAWPGAPDRARSPLRAVALVALLGGCGLDWTVPVRERQRTRGGSSGGEAAPGSTGGGGSAGAGGGDTTSTTSTTTHTSSSSSGAGDPCPPVDCGSCADCATATGGPCESPLHACEANPDCVALASCLNPCPDEACYQDCYDENPDGVYDWNDLEVCLVCGACSDPSFCGPAPAGCP